MALIASGEPNASDKQQAGAAECFPKALRYRLDKTGKLGNERVEPIAADIRPGQDTRYIASLRIVAGILGVDFDALRKRDRIRQRRRTALTGALAGLMLLIISALAAVALINHRKAAETAGQLTTANEQVEVERGRASSEQLRANEQEANAKPQRVLEAAKKLR